MGHRNPKEPNEHHGTTCIRLIILEILDVEKKRHGRESQVSAKLGGKLSNELPPKIYSAGKASRIEQQDMLACNIGKNNAQAFSKVSEQ